VALFATPEAAGGAPRSRLPHQIQTSGGQLTTDARVALLHLTSDHEPVSLDLIDGQVAMWRGPSPFELRPIAAGDLHLDRTALLRLSHDSGAQTVG
jgi:hypothetical protein